MSEDQRIRELLERVGKAEGPDRELFEELLDVFKLRPAKRAGKFSDFDAFSDWYIRINRFLNAGAWNDAALALAERALPWPIDYESSRRDGIYYGAVGQESAPSWSEGGGNSAALALLAALLRSLSEAEVSGMRGGRNNG